MRKHLHIGYVGASSILALGAVFGSSIGAAQAAPAGCSGPDAPPACHHTPTLPPAPPLLQSDPFTPIAGVENYVNVQMGYLKHPEALAGYSNGDVSRFSMSISCSNGYYYSAPMEVFAVGGYYGPGLDFEVSIPANAAAGTCYATTWDQKTLGVTSGSVTRAGTISTTGAHVSALWRIDFRP